MTASVVAITGVIGWVGLVIPHIARMLVGPNFERLLPAAMLMGAAYLVLVDTLAVSPGTPAASALVLLCVYAVPASLADEMLPWGACVLGALLVRRTAEVPPDRARRTSPPSDPG